MHNERNKNNFLWWYGICVSVLFAMVLFLMISFFSYHPFDPSWFYVSSESLVIHNACGWYGAQCAAFFFYFLGGSAFCLIIPLLMLAYISIKRLSMRTEWERVVAASYAVIVIAALLTNYGVDHALSPYPGGRIGVLFTKVLVRFFDPVGCTFFLYMSLFACVIICLRSSYIIFAQWSIRVGIYLYVMMQKYHVVNRCGYAMYIFVYTIFVRPPLFLCHFIQSLLNGSAFDDTGLIVPEGDNDFAILRQASSSPSFDKLRTSGGWKGQDEREEEQGVRREEGVGQMEEREIMEDNQGNFAEVEGLLTPFALSPSKGSKKELNESVNELVDVIDSEVSTPYSSYALPKLDIFIYEKNKDDEYDLEEELKARAHILQDKLQRFGVSGEVVAIKRGPVVTLFEYKPDVDTKLSKIIALEDDLAMALQAMSIRILAPIPGRAVVGFEVANAKRNDVLFSQVVTTPLYKNFSGTLPLVLGKGTIGEAVVVDLARMPHVLIAGSTGSGKSVALNVILISLLCKLDPDELKLILIDPKRLEFAPFADIAHLLFPIVTSPHHAAPVLRWVVQEMERRYELMAEKGARNSGDYNMSLSANDKELRLPSIVVIIDELADLMITAGRDIEELITRITQMARAAGIHMIVATQRPSVDVITGLIKANFPSRISFRVASRIDSRTILDTMGADRLLGRGDMLFLDAATSQLNRIHGAYVSDKEIESVVNHIRSQRAVEYLPMYNEVVGAMQTNSPADDQLYEDMKRFLQEVDEVSISLIQRRFRIGYNRSARLIDIFESQGLIMPQDGGKMRKVIR